MPGRSQPGPIGAQPLWHLALAAGLGCLASFAHHGGPGPGLAMLAWTAYAVWLWRQRQRRSVVTLAIAYGLGLYMPQTLWVAQTLYQRPAGSLWSALLGWAIVVVFLVGMGVLAVWLWHLGKRRHQWQGALHWGTAHGAAEWLRSLPFQGEPLPGLGHAWVDSALAGWVPYVGVLGLAWLLYCAAGLVAWAVCSNHRPVWRTATSITFLGMLLPIGLALPDPVQALGPAVSFHLLSLPPEADGKSLAAHELMARAAQVSARLVITPESALPWPAHEIASEHWRQLQAQALHTGSHYLLGLPVASPQGRHNGLLLAGPTGMQVHHKHLLMPWGEYTPLGWAWLNPWLGLTAAADLTPGAWQQAPLVIRPPHGADAPAIAVGSLICQEEASSASLQRWLPEAHVLVNTANLAWFGGTGLARQRQRMAQARALEAGRPVLRAAHAAPDAHIDHRGRLLSVQPNDHHDLRGQVQPMQGHTPFMRWVALWGQVLPFAHPPLSKADG